MTAATLPATAIAIDGGAASAAFAIERTYAEGAPYQWADELLRNIIHVQERMVADGDPNADKVEAHFSFQIVSVLKQDDGSTAAETYKRNVWNIGTPMTVELLWDVYSKLNIGGGCNRWSLNNLTGSYGMGARAATLPFTDLVVTTVIPGDGAYSIVLGSTDIAGPAGVERLYTVRRGVKYVEDGNGDIVESIADPVAQLAPADPDEDFDGDVVYLRSDHGTEIVMTTALVPEALLTSEVGGVSFLFLGKGDYTAPTEFDPTESKGESGRPTSTHLTNRFVGGGFPVYSEYMYGERARTGDRVHSRALCTSDGRTFFYDARTLKGLKDWTDRAVACPPVYLDAHGTKAVAYMLPEDYWHTGSCTTTEKDDLLAADPKAGTFEYRSDGTWGKLNTGKDEWLPHRGQGQVIVKYGAHEAYALKEGAERASDALRQWGISEERVARSVLIVIEPPVQSSISDISWGVTQNASRSNITGPNGDSLPVAAWKNAWLDNFPEAIAERLKVRPPSLSKDIPAEDIKRLEVQAFGKIASDKSKSVLDDKGKRTGDPANGSTRTSSGGKSGGGGGGGGGRGGGKSSSKSSQNASDNDKGKRRVSNRKPKRPEPPQPRFLTAEEWAAKGYPEEQLCRVESDGGNYLVELNGGHEVVNRQIAYYWDDVANGYFSGPRQRRVRDKIMRKFGGARTAGADAKAKSAVVAEIEYVYRFDALATFIGAEAVFTEPGGLDRMKFNDHVTGNEMAMTVALSGYYPQAEAIKSRLNGLAA